MWQIKNERMATAEIGMLKMTEIQDRDRIDDVERARAKQFELQSMRPS